MLAKGFEVPLLLKDPREARLGGLWPQARNIAVDPESLSDGPTGPRLAVLDYNVDLDCCFAPAALLKRGEGFKGLAGKTKEKLLESFTFHQVNVWGVASRTLALLEAPYALGRPVPWASGQGRLFLMPHATYDQNAFYDRDTNALHFGYFEGPDGQPVYTCLSHDIIAHELGHAVLDGLKPYYNEITSAQTAAFHEYFGDAVAMLSSLDDRSVAMRVVASAPERLPAKNVVSAIASEFGAAIKGLDDEAYLRGAWKRPTMMSLRGVQEEHDLSEVLTGVFYEFLETQYARIRKALVAEEPPTTLGHRQERSMRALREAASLTLNMMIRAIDYCPPVDVRFGAYARAALRADQVAYPHDDAEVRRGLARIFEARGIAIDAGDAPEVRARIAKALSSADIERETATKSDAYLLVDRHREVLGIPARVNLTIASVYRTHKQARGGYRPPREIVVEVVWSEDVVLSGKRFAAFADSAMPLWCGATLVFDANGNLLEVARVLATDARRAEFLHYVAYLVKSGAMGLVDGARGLGAPLGHTKYRAQLQGTRMQVQRNCALRHHRGER